MASRYAARMRLVVHPCLCGLPVVYERAGVGVRALDAATGEPHPSCAPEEISQRLATRRAEAAVVAAWFTPEALGGTEPAQPDAPRRRTRRQALADDPRYAGEVHLP